MFIENNNLFKEKIMKTITILTPMYNEQENIQQFYKEVSKVASNLSEKYILNFSLLMMEVKIIH